MQSNQDLRYKFVMLSRSRAGIDSSCIWVFSTLLFQCGPSVDGSRLQLIIAMVKFNHQLDWVERSHRADKMISRRACEVTLNGIKFESVDWVKISSH